MMEALTEQDLQRIHDASLAILESNGVTFHQSPEAVEILGKHGCSVDAFRVRFPRKLVVDSLGLVPDRDQLSFDYAPLAVTDPMSLKKGEKAAKLEALFGDAETRKALNVTDEQAARIASWLPEGME